MAPEQFKWRRTSAVEASRCTDVFALGALSWEVLSGRAPFSDDGRTEAEHIADLHSGGTLDWDAVPADVPGDLREVLVRCVATARDARPTAASLCTALRDARERLEEGSFDVFLSHVWVRDEYDRGCHAPLTTAVLRALRDGAHTHVWLDLVEMERDMGAAMRAGIAASKVVVALISRAYAARPNCMLELREAATLGKPIIAALVDAGSTAVGAPAWWPRTDASSPEERELASLIGGSEFLVADLRAAAIAAAAARYDGGGEMGELLARPEALPCLVRLVNEALGRRVRSSAGGGPTASPAASRGASEGVPTTVDGSNPGPPRELRSAAGAAANPAAPVATSAGMSSAHSPRVVHLSDGRFYCGADVGSEGYAAFCGRCDGRCGPSNGCQCRSCAAQSSAAGHTRPPCTAAAELSRALTAVDALGLRLRAAIKVGVPAFNSGDTVTCAREYTAAVGDAAVTLEVAATALAAHGANAPAVGAAARNAHAALGVAAKASASDAAWALRHAMDAILKDLHDGPLEIKVLQQAAAGASAAAAKRLHGRLKGVPLRLEAAIAIGVPAFNSGDHAACAREYAVALGEAASTLKAAAAELSVSGVSAGAVAAAAREAAEALAKARGEEPRAAAWTLRHAMDAVLKAAPFGV